MMSGEATPSQMGGLLMGMRVRGETVDEITGAVSTMRAKMTKVAAPPEAIDVVGTGGDGSGSYNVSTCAALIVAGAGVPVAKHGNRALSSKSGAADVLGALGVKIDLRPDEITRCIYEAGIGFMFAPAHHPATKNVAADPRRAWHPHDLQSARAAVQSGGREAADDRRVLAAMDRAAGAGAESAGLGSGLGGARLRRARRDHDVGPDARRGAGERRGAHLRDQSRGHRHREEQARDAARRRRREQRGGAEGRAQGQQGAVSRYRGAERGGGFDRRRQGEGPEGRRGAWPQSRSTAARPRAGSTG